MSVRVPLGAIPRHGSAVELRQPLLAPREAPSVRSRPARAGLLVLLLCAGAVAVCAGSTPTLLPESIRPAPAWLAGPLSGLGASLPFPLLAVLLGAMFLGYVLVAEGAQRLTPRTVIGGVALLHAVVLLAPPLVSTDVFSYQAYARMGSIYGANPYLHGPSAIALDPLYPFIGARWVSTASVYGPLFTLFSYLLAPLSIAASTLSYKLLATASSLGAVALVWRAAGMRGIDPRRAIALVGLNPLVVLYGVGGGHNDLLMLAPMMAGVYLILAHRERAGAGSLALAAGIKLSAGLLLPFAIAAGGRPALRDRRREMLLGAGVVAAVVAVIGFGVFGLGSLRLLATLVHNQSQGDWHSIPGILSAGLGLHLIGRIVGAALAIAFLALSARLLRGVWRGTHDWIAAAGWSTFALLLSAGSVLPWYLAWLMPLAALGGDRRLWRASLGITGVVMAMQVLGYIPHGVLIFGP